MATTLVTYFFQLLTALHIAPGIPTPVADRLAALPEGSLDIDNDIYDCETFDWWSDSCGLHHLNPLRVGYFLDKLERARADRSLVERGQGEGGRGRGKILDVGCGAGIATEEIYRRLYAADATPTGNGNEGGEDKEGYEVIGLDPSERSISVARLHAASHSPSLDIVYQVGSLYSLPYDTSSIDAIICSDVLEHLYNLPLALQEIQRVLKPGGIFSFDTINRTPLSYYLSIWMLQDVLRAMQNDTHDHRMYVTPQEIHVGLERVGLQPGPKTHLVGMGPAFHWPHVILWRLMTGTGGFMGSFLRPFKETTNLQISYLHWASKPLHQQGQ